MDSRAGSHAKHLRQRELPRRDRCRHGDRSVRDSNSLSDRSRAGSSCSSVCESSRSGSRAAHARAMPARSRAGAVCPTRSMSWCEPMWRIVADVTVDRTTGSDQGRSRIRRARLRPDHQPRRAAQSDRRQCRADGQPHPGREADVQPQRGHQPQLGKLPDPDFSRMCPRLLSI